MVHPSVIILHNLGKKNYQQKITQFTCIKVSNNMHLVGLLLLAGIMAEYKIPQKATLRIQ